MQNALNYSSENLIIPSILAFNTLNHVHFLSSGAKDLLRFLIISLRVKEGGHNLTDVKYFSNSEMAKKLECSTETVRKRKEELHAHGVILIDNKTYGQYVITDKNGILRRYKPDQIQSVVLTDQFQVFMLRSGRDKKLADISFFSPHEIWLKKIEDSRARNLSAVMKHWAKKLGITLGISCEEVPIKLDVIHSSTLPIKLGQLSISDNRKTQYEYLNRRGPASQGSYDLSQNKSNSIKEILTQSALSRNILHQQANKNIVKKPFTSAVKDFCDKLLTDGMDLKEVACRMIEQRYASTIEDFKASYYRLPIE